MTVNVIGRAPHNPVQSSAAMINAGPPDLDCNPHSKNHFLPRLGPEALQWQIGPSKAADLAVSAKGGFGWLATTVKWRSFSIIWMSAPALRR